MAAVTPTSTSPPADVPAPAPAATVVLRGISWELYERLCDEIPQRMPHSYDEGVLELMSPSYLHGRRNRLVARFLDVLTEEFNIPILSAGAMTLKKQSIFKGVEPDDVFWFAQEAAMRGRAEYDPENDPVPDLVIETEVSRTVLDRLHLLAALGVAEVWRSTTAGIEVLHLSEDGSYEQASHSLAMPFLKVSDLSPFLTLDDSVSETTHIRTFRQWVRDRFPDHCRPE